MIAAAGRYAVRLDHASGKEMWRSKPLCGAGRMATVVRVEGDIAYVGAGANVNSLDAGSGESRWQAVLSHAVTNLIVTPERILAGGEGRISCVLLDGQVAWTNDLKGLGVVGPAMAIGGLSDDWN